MQALLMPLTHVKSRRQFDQDCLEYDHYRENLSRIIGEEVPELASADTVNYLLEKLAPESLEAVLPKLVGDLIRMRALDRFRFDGEFLVAIDGTELMRQVNRRHCEHCLTAEHKDDRIDYFHQVAAANLVAKNGMALCIGHEFIENIDGRYDKQDCETHAGRRLLNKIKQRFPHLRICILGDSLYACDATIDKITSNGWSFFLSFLPGRTPTLYAEAEASLAAAPENRIIVVDCERGETCIYQWVTGLRYREHRFHAVFVDITEHDTGKETRLAYLTNHRPNKGNVQELVDQGGRQRAKIENCFNTQKNHGYQLEHAYGSKGHALKNYFTIIQIGYMIHQFMTRTDLFGKLADTPTTRSPVRCALHAYSTLRTCVARLAEALRNRLISCRKALFAKADAIQIRFIHDTG
jgi:hypothetical protein